MRGLAPAILFGSAALLAACNRSAQAPAAPPAASAAPAPAAQSLAAFWSIQALDDQNRPVSTTLLCADQGVQQSFTRPLPSPNGKPCALVAPAVTNGGRFAARCKSEDGRLLDIQAESVGDLSRDFTTKLLIHTDVKGQESLVQTLHYRRLGACPEGWEVGDAAAPGDTKTVNSVSGAVRQLPAPVAPPPN